MKQLNTIYLKAGEKALKPQWVGLEQGAYFEIPKGDDGVLLCLTANEGGYAYVRKGDGPMAGNDLAVSIGTDQEIFVYLESGRFMQTKGENKGRILVDSNGYEMSACVVQLV